MHTAIAPTLAVGSVELLRRVSVRAGESDWHAWDAELLADHFLYLRGVFQGAMRDFRGRLSEGADARQLGRDARMTLEALGSYLAILATRLPPESQLFAGLPAETIRQLREAHGQVQEIGASLAPLLDLLGAPRPAVDWLRVQAAEAEIDRGEREDLADVLARRSI